MLLQKCDYMRGKLYFQNSTLLSLKSKFGVSKTKTVFEICTESACGLLLRTKDEKVRCSADASAFHLVTKFLPPCPIIEHPY